MDVPVISYHKIDRPTADVKIRGAYTSPERFLKQLAYLKRSGFDFYTASELVKSYSDDGRFPANAICLTFDDGWKDNYTNAFPIMKQFGVKATIFLVPSCIGRTTDQVTAEGEGAREHLSENDIREMSAFGIEFGSHSMNHKLFNRITSTEIEFEVTESKKHIENLLQKECGVFAYPAGFFTDFAKSAIKQAGYSAAFSTVYGSDKKIDFYELNRLEILRRDKFPFRFARKIRSLVSTG
ncbi:MAG: polysaccharide deacetylase family protein [Blastocatellia bacterium]